MGFDQENLNSHSIFGLKGQHVTGWVYAVDEKGDIFYNCSNMVYETKTTNGLVTMNQNKFDFDPKNYETDKVVISNQYVRGVSDSYPQVSASFLYEARKRFSLGP
jgi:hypothetical protein